MFEHHLPVRVYHADTDACGIVNHANYLMFFERGRTEALRAQGINLVNLYAELGIFFVVHSLTAEFRRSARLDELLYVVTKVESVGHASVMYHQSIHLEAPVGVLLCNAKIKLACVNQSQQPCALPKMLSMEIKK